MTELIQSESNPDVRPMIDDEVDAVSGGGLLFAIAFAAGVVACNVKNDRPWYEF
jgi:hypothetical protein